MALMQVLISTYGRDGLSRVGAMKLPVVENISYIVSCQSEPCELPAPLIRPDVDVRFTPTSGLSVNRNITLGLATAPYALIADDDIEYDGNALRRIIGAFEENPNIDIAAFMLKRPGSRSYPPSMHDLWKYFKNYLPCSAEIAFRMDSIKDKSLQFNENFGAGTSDMACGEEDIFLLQAKNCGLNGMFFPIAIGKHEGYSTGNRLAEVPGVLKAQGAVITLKYPLSWILRIPLKAYRTRQNFFTSARHLLRGAAFALSHSYLRRGNYPI